jgi:hypothetical protein
MLFNQIIAPLQEALKEEVESLDKDAITYKLSLYFFTINLIYGIVKEIRSISLLITEIKTAQNIEEFHLVQVSKAMYSDAFVRYDPKIFRRIFLKLLDQLTFIHIPELEKLGRFILVDGSIFPAFNTMDWASYKSTSKALKMHLSFELNRMIPVQFISTNANGCERKALLKMLETGVTYIADKGYFSFNILQQIAEQKAFFILRFKSNIKCTFIKEREVIMPEAWLSFFTDISDSMMYFSNDSKERHYRVVSFKFHQELYRIVTNRTDLTTGEIIMLYAYRWQIELFFRSIKCTFNALHLWSHDKKGIEIQFYLYLIAYLLLLNFKQNLIQEQIQEGLPDDKIKNKKSKKAPKKNYISRTPARGLVTLLGEKLKLFWKISIHWMKCIQNLLFEPLTPENKIIILSIQ